MKVVNDGDTVYCAIRFGCVSGCTEERVIPQDTSGTPEEGCGTRHQCLWQAVAARDPDSGGSNSGDTTS